MPNDPSARSAHAIERARAVLAGEHIDPWDLLEVVAVLRAERKFGLGRKALAKVAAREPRVASDEHLRRRYAQQRALFTYKDPDLQPDRRLADALAILAQSDDLAKTKDQETLGLVGAIYMRMWQLNGRELDLETSLSYYLRGAELGVRGDRGYSAIKAAFVQDLLAELETTAGESAKLERGPADRRESARELRAQVVSELAPLSASGDDDWWLLVTLGEAHYGRGEYELAAGYLARAKQQPVSDWERETSARQLTKLLKLREADARRSGGALDPRATEILRDFLGDAKEVLESLVQGKVGLALSGGGFRASLYHIGVLARLAELDLLRHVECLSCVSGGSIIGAYYYLEVRRLLNQKPDGVIEPADYIEIVRRISTRFLAGVETNIRTRIGAEWLTNLKMIGLPNYSRTARAAQLYESQLYSRIEDGEQGAPRWLNELQVNPPGEPDFHPKDHNWRRKNKVPMLVLNATALNTGHNWQFTSTWMGEPPSGIDAHIDANSRLRRMYYRDAPAPYRRIRLGEAVAASACVPGLFEPLSFPELYEPMPGTRRRPIVRLVDGGVYDNQGVSALLEQGCSLLLVSDASGQMMDQEFPSNGLLGVPLRANSILQARVRVSQLEDLQRRVRAGQLHGVMFVHLKQDLLTRPLDWIGCQDTSEPLHRDPRTGYGVQRAIQRRLASIRTDLDSFSETEAYALMTSAYLATRTALDERDALGWKPEPIEEIDWNFLALVPLLKDSAAAEPGSPLMRRLKVADKLFFKAWLLLRRLQIATGALVLFTGSWVALQLWNEAARSERLFSIDVTWGRALWAGAITLGILAFAALLGPITRYRKTLPDVLIGIAMTTLGFPLARLQLAVFDRLFLRHGSLERLLEETRSRSDRPPGNLEKAVTTQ